MKPCPYCLAELENATLQCPHCRRWLDPSLDSTLNADAPPIVLAPRRTSGLAIGSLVCAIFGWGPGSIVAVILGHVALRQIRRDPLRVKGKGVAKAGIVLGWLGIVALTAAIWLGIHFRKTFQEQPQIPRPREVNLTTAELLPFDHLPFADPWEKQTPRFTRNDLSRDRRGKRSGKSLSRQHAPMGG